MNRHSFRRSMFTLSVSVLLTGVVIGRAATTDADGSASLARVGNVDVKESDIQSDLQALSSEQQQTLQRNPAALNKTVKSLLLQRLILEEALAKQWDKQPAVASQLQRLRDNAVVETYLKSVAEPPADYPAVADVSKIYDANKGSFLIPKQYHLAQIFVAARKDADAATQAQATAKVEAIRKSLAQAGSDFRAVARIQSDDPGSAQKGGEIGWVTEAQIQAELRTRVTSLAPKTVSEPIHLNDGWHILEVLEIKEPYTASLAEVRPLIIQRLRTQQTQVNEQAYVSRLLEQNPIAINQPALEKLLK